VTAARQPLSAGTFALTVQVVYDPLPVSESDSSAGSILDTPGIYDLSLVFAPAAVLSMQSIGSSDHVAGVTTINGVSHTLYYWSDISVPAPTGGSGRVLFERGFVVQVSASLDVSFFATTSSGGIPPDPVQAVAETAINLPL
jgi:hypothetical protein